MTPINFTYYGKLLPDKRVKINLYIKNLGATDNDSPREQRKGEEDADHIIRDIVGNASDDGDKLLCNGEPPEGDWPIFRFTIGVTFDRKTKLCHYSRVGYERLDWDPRFAPIAQLGIEQYEYTMSVLRKREKIEYANWEKENAGTKKVP